MTTFSVAQPVTDTDAEADGARLADALALTDDLATAWGDWMEATYDPDAQPIG